MSTALPLLHDGVDLVDLAGAIDRGKSGHVNSEIEGCAIGGRHPHPGKTGLPRGRQRVFEAVFEGWRFRHAGDPSAFRRKLNSVALQFMVAPLFRLHLPRIAMRKRRRPELRPLPRLGPRPVEKPVARPH
jgi:hypothetical protein